jgi:hypothetical protein
MKLLGDIASSHKVQRERDALYLVQATHRASAVQAEARKEVGGSQTMLEERTERGQWAIAGRGGGNEEGCERMNVEARCNSCNERGKDKK